MVLLELPIAQASFSFDLCSIVCPLAFFAIIIILARMAYLANKKRNEAQALLFQELKSDLNAELVEIPMGMGSKKRLTGNYKGTAFSIEEDVVMR